MVLAFLSARGCLARPSYGRKKVFDWSDVNLCDERLVQWALKKAKDEQGTGSESDGSFGVESGGGLN